MLFFVPTNTCFGLWTYIDDLKSYYDIYKIKWRDFTKPLAIFLDSLQILKNITNLTNKQIEFIKQYKKPFTILVNINNVKDEKIISSIEKLPNKQEYKKLAFRIAHCNIHKKLINKHTYFFLTSGNRSGELEIKSSSEIQKQFEKEIKNYNIKLLAEDNHIIDSKQNSSDIFEFINNQLIFCRRF